MDAETQLHSATQQANPDHWTHNKNSSCSTAAWVESGCVELLHSSSRLLYWGQLLSVHGDLQTSRKGHQQPPMKCRAHLQLLLW